MLAGAANRVLRRVLVAALSLAAALSAAGLGGRAARAQVAPGDSIPSRIYFNTFPLYFDGEYRNALAAFLAESRGGIRSVNSRWIDSICYFTMAGECYYQLGQLPAALDSYNSALKLYIAYSDWMMRVQFPPSVTATVGATRAAPWGQSKRGALIGNFPDAILIGQGQVDQTAVVTRGGVVQQPILFPVHVSEIVRATSLAIRRRKELLGPVCKHDPLTGSLVEALLRRPGPPNHWSEAWTSVELGCAYAAAGNAAQAKAALERGLLASGQFDHPLTSTALLELGKLALEAGEFAPAARYFEEATYASLAFTNPTNLEEGFRYGALAHLLQNQKGPYPLLAPAIVWAKNQGNRQLQCSLLLSAAENAAVLGDANEASALINNARLVAARSDLLGSQLGARLNHLSALAAYQGGNVAAGDQSLASALTFQRSGSLWGFQIAQTDSRYLNGELSDRTALGLYETVLRDPAPSDWVSNPLECLSMLVLSTDSAYEHWFEAALKNSKDHELALEIADRARRHRFYSSLPMGGRLLSLRWVLEGPLELLGERGLLERQDLLARYPRYAQLSTECAKLRAALADKPALPDSGEARRLQSEQLTALASASQEQELVLRELAVRREPAEMLFPPLRKTKDIQQALPDGQVLLAFFATSRNLYAFLYSREKYAAWHVQSPATLQKQIPNLLREMGNFESNHELTASELAKTNWKTTAAKVMSLLVEHSNVDLAGNFDEIVIVPDGLLWYLPFEALPVGKGDQKKLLLSQARVRYAPTAGLAVPYTTAHKPRSTTGVVLGKLHPQNDDGVAARAYEQIQSAVPDAVRLEKALPAPANIYRTVLDGLVVLDDVEPGETAYDWSPTQLDRAKSTGTLASWFSLPWGGPETIVLPGYHTAAENALRKGSPGGNDLFLAICGMMSTGARTILISRWRPAGQTSFDLVREFEQELPHATAAEAWQRSVRVATDAPIEPEHEPRVKKSSITGEPPRADHPFFWAGYMLVNSGVLDKDAEGAKLPGLAVPKTAPAANPPLVDALPKPADNAAADESPAPAAKRAKKTKTPARSVPKKASPRPKASRDAGNS